MASNAVFVKGRIIKARKARKEFVCKECQQPILPGEIYENIEVGSGLAAIKFPKRVHPHCLPAYLDKIPEPDEWWKGVKV
jgi:hypothetical protein